MSNTKRCSGYKDHWECSEEYPDHTVPVEKFGPGGDGLQVRCRKCTKYRDGIRNPIQNAIISEATKIAGNRDILRSMPKEDRAKVMEMAKNKKAGTDNILQFTPRTWTSKSGELKTAKSPRFHDGKPRVKRGAVKKKPSERTGKYREGPGYVYIYQDERIPEDLKIGSSKTSYGRLNSAGTWGLYRCLGEYKFEKRYQAEDKVHEALAEYRLFANKEIFKVSFEEALNNILAIQHLLEDEDFYGVVDLGDADES